MEPIFDVMYSAILLTGAAGLTSARADEFVMAQANPSAASAQMADGEVKKIDKDAGEITIRHGPIPSLQMHAMTMVYRVKEPAKLDAVTPGDYIRFRAEGINGALTVTGLESVK